MNENEFFLSNFVVCFKGLLLFVVSDILGTYNEIVYSFGVTFTTLYCFYNLYLLHKKSKQKN
jgi:hypothetical protein